MVKLNVLQPFKVRYQVVLSPLQMQILVKCYQPIMGNLALSLYLTLMQQTSQVGIWGDLVMQGQLVSQLDSSASACAVARAKLEAVGLLRTYQQKQASDTAGAPTLYYDVQAPLEAAQFIHHPVYSAMLFSKLGDQAYYQLVRSFEWTTLDTVQFVEVTTPFGQVFAYPTEEALQSVPLTDDRDVMYRQQYTSEVLALRGSFDLELFYQYLAMDGVTESQFTHTLGQHVMMLHEAQGLDEQQLSQIVKLAVNPQTKQVDMAQVKRLAQRHAISVEQTTAATAPTVAPTKVDAQSRKQQLQDASLGLSETEIQVIMLAEQLPLEVFLHKTKQSKGGFATDSEKYYVKQLMDKTSLPMSVVNLLVYYLLAVQNQEAIFKKVLEQIANEWQQQKVLTVEQVFPYIRAKEAKQHERPTTSRGKWQSKKGVPKRTEPIPKWKRAQQTGADADFDAAAAAQVKAQLEQLHKRGEA